MTIRKVECVMLKKISRLLMIIMGSMAVLTACNKDLGVDIVDEDATLTIHVKADVASLTNDVSTRTYIGTYGEKPNTILWGRQESLKIAVLGDGLSDKATWATSTTSDFENQPSATFSFTIEPTDGNKGVDYTYVGVYPAVASVDESSIKEHKVLLKSIQDATSDSYDPEAYILIARPESGHNSSNANWNAFFRRATALNKITLKNIPEAIESVELIVPTGKNFTGNRYIDLSTGESGEVYNGDNKVTINYETPNVGILEEGVNCKTVWFTSWDTEIAEGEHFTIIARSATRFYTRTIEARAGGILFKEGYLNTLGVNMGSAEISYINYAFTLLSNDVVYDNNSHAAFTSIFEYEGMTLLAFREGVAHRPSSEADYGCIKVLANQSGAWNPIATISDASKDLRDPFFIEVDGRLRMYIMYNAFIGGEYQHAGTVYCDYNNGSWSELRQINHDLNHIASFWKVRKHGNKYYSVAYYGGEYPALMSSNDGINWTTVTLFELEGALSEADMCFVGDTLYVCLRKNTPISDPAWWGVANYPFVDFSWKEMETHIESPTLTWLPYSKTLLLSGRERVNGNVDVSLFTASKNGKLERISLLDEGTGGDRGYPSFLYKGEQLYCTYYTYSSTTSLTSVKMAKWDITNLY